jgi:hypothetical protein
LKKGIKIIHFDGYFKDGHDFYDKLFAFEISIENLFGCLCYH